MPLLDDGAPPPWQVQRWFNTDANAPPTLDGLRGRVVVLHSFQMLCPGCVSHAIPQMAQLQRAFARTDLALIGLHTVFEHHAVMGADALQVFMHEYRITYPVGIDQPGEDGDPLPLTMRAYGLRGTPSLLLFDRRGRLRMHEFGQVHDLALGYQLGCLLTEPADAA
ncbi:MAG: redoxin domain-containing protein [Aquabacterium sp.]